MSEQSKDAALAALDRALEQHHRFAPATITRPCDDCDGTGVVQAQEGIWHPELGQYVVEMRPGMCFWCNGAGEIKVTPSGAEMLDRVCNNVGLGGKP